jgi:hypothetical protein
MPIVQSYQVLSLKKVWFAKTAVMQAVMQFKCLQMQDPNSSFKCTALQKRKPLGQILIIKYNFIWYLNAFDAMQNLRSDRRVQVAGKCIVRPALWTTSDFFIYLTRPVDWMCILHSIEFFPSFLAREDVRRVRPYRWASNLFRTYNFINICPSTLGHFKADFKHAWYSLSTWGSPQWLLIHALTCKVVYDWL